MQGYGCGWPVEGFGGMCGGRRLADSSAIADRSLVRCGQLRIRGRTLPAACRATDYGRVMTSLGPAGSRNVTPRS